MFVVVDNFGKELTLATRCPINQWVAVALQNKVLSLELFDRLLNLHLPMPQENRAEEYVVSRRGECHLLYLVGNLLFCCREVGKVKAFIALCLPNQNGVLEDAAEPQKLNGQVEHSSMS
jgi:hypothetical protein